MPAATWIHWMETILLALPENEKIARRLSDITGTLLGKSEIRHFPDGETYLRLDSNVSNRKVVLVCTLDRPDKKILPLYYLAKTVRDMGCDSICLVAPYLAYMRQDKIFRTGEAVTSEYFAQLLSSFVDYLITIDPHLHRRSTLAEIYSIPTQVSHASSSISEWIKKNIETPVIIGPDEESKQWVSEVANNSMAPFIILKKHRLGDQNVEISTPDIEKYSDHRPVLIDDIISTGNTMIETIKRLKQARMKQPLCIGIHAVFAGNTYENLRNAGAERVITCNTIEHPSNSIDVTDLLTGFQK